MYRTLKKIYYKQPSVKKYGYPILLLYKFIEAYLLPTKWLIKKQFKRAHNYPLNISHPKTLNEKIQWMKLNVRDKLYTQCADKFLVRDYIAKTIGSEHVIPLVGIYSGATEIKVTNLPSYPIIIKATHDSGSYYIVSNKNVIDWKALNKIMDKWLKRNYYTLSKEWQYKNIQPKIIIEKLLIDSNNKIPTDYKFHCFHGEPKVIYVTSDREGKTKRSLYDINWEPLPFVWASVSKREKYGKNIKNDAISSPNSLPNMLSIARKLSRPFPYVRIDLYEVDGKVYCGEITFYQGGGFDVITPKEWDTKLGNLINLDACTLRTPSIKL